MHCRCPSQWDCSVGAAVAVVAKTKARACLDAGHRIASWWRTRMRKSCHAARSTSRGGKHARAPFHCCACRRLKRLFWNIVPGARYCREFFNIGCDDGVVSCKDAPAVAYGNVFEGYGTVSAPSQTREAYCWQKGAVANVKLRTCEQAGRADVLGMLTAIRQQAITLLTQPQRIDNGLAAALVCGWRGALDEETYRDFQVSGLAHVVAVSGAHLSIMVAFVASAVRLLRLPRNLSMALQISLVLAYLVLTAVPVSAVRAAVMTIAGLLSWTARRRASSLSSLSVCMAGLIALDPLAALSASFALSAFATLGIVLFGSLIDRWIERLAPRVPAFAREALALTLASSVLATPLSVALFSQLPLVAPLANMATGPLFGPVCTAGILCSMAALAFPAAAGCMAAWCG